MAFLLGSRRAFCTTARRWDAAKAAEAIGSDASAKLREYLKLAQDSKPAESEKLSRKSYQLLTAPEVPITPDFLRKYVQLQIKLKRPYSLPDAFHLFANKPKPLPNGGFKPANRYAAENAIESELAQRALTAALAANDLTTAVGVIETCFRTPAYERQKLLRVAAIPAALSAGVPGTAYLLGSAFASYNTNIDAGTASMMAGAGVVMYSAITGSLALMSKFTQMSHMVRVTWVPGTSLYQRWLREEERAAWDAVAVNFGYKDSTLFGEETGETWEAVRDEIGRRGMVLDAVELMEDVN